MNLNNSSVVALCEKAFQRFTWLEPNVTVLLSVMETLMISSFVFLGKRKKDGRLAVFSFHTLEGMSGWPTPPEK